MIIEYGGAEGDRTPDLKTASLARSQLRHSPKIAEKKEEWIELTPAFYLGKLPLASASGASCAGST